MTLWAAQILSYLIISPSKFLLLTRSLELLQESQNTKNVYINRAFGFISHTR
jgi:hypothetical protein